MATHGFLTNIKKYTTDLLKHSSRQNTAKPVILILLVYALEQIITTKTFYSCPATGYRAYGALFLFGPGLCFFMLSLLFNEPFFKTVRGCCRRNFDHARVFRSTARALRRSIFVALVWILLAFANTQFYLCFRLGPEPSKERLKNMSELEREKIRMLISEEKTRSAVICWFIFLSAIFFAFFYTIIRTCIFSKAEGILPSIQEYEKLERKAVAANFLERMEMIAKEEGEKQVETHLKMAQKEGKPMYEVVSEAKEWLEKEYAERRTSSLTVQDDRHEHENGQANKHPDRIMAVTNV